MRFPLSSQIAQLNTQDQKWQTSSFFPYLSPTSPLLTMQMKLLQLILILRCWPLRVRSTWITQHDVLLNGDDKELKFSNVFWSGLNQKEMSTTAFESLAVPTKKPTRRPTKMPRTRKPEFIPSTAPSQEPTSVFASSYNRRPQYHIFVSTNPSVLWFQPEYACVTDEFIMFHIKSTYVCRCDIDIFQNIKCCVLQSQSLWLPITPPFIWLESSIHSVWFVASKATSTQRMTNALRLIVQYVPRRYKIQYLHDCDLPYSYKYAHNMRLCLAFCD